MELEILLSAMNLKNFDIIKKTNINSNTIIINQSNKEIYKEKILNGYKIRMFSNTKRGLSISRNEALLNATGDICVLCDDDVTYVQDYVRIISDAFTELGDADIIIFNTTKSNYIGTKKRNIIKKIRLAPKNKYYGSVRIAFKRESILSNKIKFNENFGAGSLYTAGEESLFLKEARNKGLKIYEYPKNIASVDYSESTWFEGYDENFFYDKGAWLAAAYPKFKFLFKYYYMISFKNHTILSKSEIIKYLNYGIDGYKELKTYNDYMNDICDRKL